MGEKGEIVFRDRTACPVCVGAESTPVWTGKFSDPYMRRMMELFTYSVDTDEVLGDGDFALVACSGCKMRYHARVLDDASVPVVYGIWTDQDQVDRFHSLHGVGNAVEDGHRRTKMALRLRKLVSGYFDDPLTWLDFGCGNGGTLAAGRSLGFRMVGIEPSATRRTEAERTGVPVFVDLNDLDSADVGPLHLVSLEQVLEHLTDPLGTLQSLYDRMEPGAVLFVAVPDCRGIDEPDDFHTFHKVQPVEHVNAFTPDSLRSICERAGFRPERRPPAWVTTEIPLALRAFGGLVWQPSSTEGYFRKV